MSTAGLPPEQRRNLARLGGLTTASRGHHDTETGRRAAEERFTRQVIAAASAAGEDLAEVEIARRTRAARRLFFARLAYDSAKARSYKARARRGLPPIEKAAPAYQEPGTATEARRGPAERPTEA